MHRVAELAQGFSGAIANEELHFMIFERVTIVIASLALTILHPALIFRKRWHEADFRLNGKTSSMPQSSIEEGKEEWASDDASGQDERLVAGRD